MKAHGPALDSYPLLADEGSLKEITLKYWQHNKA